MTKISKAQKKRQTQKFYKNFIKILCVMLTEPVRDPANLDLQRGLAKVILANQRAKEWGTKTCTEFKEALPPSTLQESILQAILAQLTLHWQDVQTTTEAKLFYSDITDNELTAVCSFLKLEQLDLVECPNVKSPTIVNETLRTVWFYDIALTNESVEAMFRGCPALEKVHFDYCSQTITTECIKNLQSLYPRVKICGWVAK
jgi:hypothetical protein